MQNFDFNSETFEKLEQSQQKIKESSIYNKHHKSIGGFKSPEAKCLCKVIVLQKNASSKSANN